MGSCDGDDDAILCVPRCPVQSGLVVGHGEQTRTGPEHLFTGLNGIGRNTGHRSLESEHYGPDKLSVDTLPFMLAKNWRLLELRPFVRQLKLTKLIQIMGNIKSEKVG